VRGEKSPNRSSNVSDFFGKTNPYDTRNFYAFSGPGLWSWTFKQGDESIRFALHQAAIETWGIPEGAGQESHGFSQSVYFFGLCNV
jgi:hypothetical protein